MDQFLCLADCDALRRIGLPYSTRTARQLAKEGRFPEPVHLSPRKVGWFASQVEDYMAAMRPSA